MSYGGNKKKSPTKAQINAEKLRARKVYEKYNELNKRKQVGTKSVQERINNNARELSRVRNDLERYKLDLKKNGEINNNTVRRAEAKINLKKKDLSFIKNIQEKAKKEQGSKKFKSQSSSKKRRKFNEKLGKTLFAPKNNDK